MEQSNDLKTQVEYYLSDKNLSMDKFFHTKISDAQDGYIPIEFIMNCNKIKNLGVGVTQVAEAVKNSTELELDEKQQNLRRKGNKDLPELQPRKKVKKDDNNQHPDDKKQAKNISEDEMKIQLELEELNTIDPQIVQIKGTTESKVTWKQIHDFITNKFSANLFYCRFKDGEGQFILNRNKVNKDLVEQLTKEPQVINEESFTITLAEGDNLKKFWEEHGSHYNMCIQNQKKIKNDRKKKIKSKDPVQTREVLFANKRYHNISKLKQVFQSIVSKQENGDRIKEPNHTLINELLKFHDNKNKLEDLDHFVVDVHPEHKDSRCFFVVKKDGTKQDFSITKCLNNVSESQKAPKAKEDKKE